MSEFPSSPVAGQFIAQTKEIIDLVSAMAKINESIAWVVDRALDGPLCARAEAALAEVDIFLREARVAWLDYQRAETVEEVVLA
jgi:hypothetical protein